MAKFVNVVLSEYTLPLEVSYTCAKCGKEVVSKEDIFLYGSLSGINTNDAKKILASSLPSDAQQQLKNMADYGKKHLILMPYDPLATGRRVHKFIQFRCPACGIGQVPDAGGKHATPVSASGKGRISSILAIVLVLAWAVGMFVFLSRNPMEPMNLLYVTLGAIAGGVALGVWNSLSKKKAWENPEVMLKQYGSVVNPAVYADFSPYGLEKILMNSEK